MKSIIINLNIYNSNIIITYSLALDHDIHFKDMVDN